MYSYNKNRRWNNLAVIIVKNKNENNTDNNNNNNNLGIITRLPF